MKHHILPAVINHLKSKNDDSFYAWNLIDARAHPLRASRKVIKLFSRLFSTQQHVFPQQENASGSSTSVLRTLPNSAQEKKFPSSCFPIWNVESDKVLFAQKMRKNLNFSKNNLILANSVRAEIGKRKTKKLRADFFVAVDKRIRRVVLNKPNKTTTSFISSFFQERFISKVAKGYVSTNVEFSWGVWLRFYVSLIVFIHSPASLSTFQSF